MQNESAVLLTGEVGSHSNLPPGIGGRNSEAGLPETVFWLWKRALLWHTPVTSECMRVSLSHLDGLPTWPVFTGQSLPGHSLSGLGREDRNLTSDTELRQ